MIVKPFVLAFIATAGFAVLFNIERKKAVVASFGGSLAWVVYETLNTLTGADLLSLFAASIAIGIYSEIMARKMKSPATIFYIPGFITLVPGAYVYYTMLEAAEQNYGGAFECIVLGYSILYG